MQNQLNFLYDREADVLYVSKGHRAFTDYVELGDNLILRLDPKSKEIVGFTIIDFAARFAGKAPPLAVPLKATFERAGKTRRVKVAAEKKVKYRARRKRVSTDRFAKRINE